jgi:two-component sensor histidine kinase
LRYVLDGPPVELSADLAVPVGMALHELTANAARFGALSVPGGRVELRWNVGEVEGVRKLQLDWREYGGPPVQKPQHEGFGSTLLQKVLPLQSNADIRIDFDETGVRFWMQAPLIERRLVPPY